MDDELWARKRIATLLRSESDIEVVSQCARAAEAVAAIEELAIDLVFLDVQMPDADGFEVVDTIGAERMPRIIFATAYDKYALRAFDAHALDYLLKPFDEERFYRALARARKDVHEKGNTPEAALQCLLELVRCGPKYLQRLAVKSCGRVIFLKSAEVEWIEASGNYVSLHAGRETYLSRTTMNSLELKLDPQQFARIHRSAIVNLDSIKELLPWFHGEQVAVLKNGTRLTVGRVFREQLSKLLRTSV